MSVIYAHLTKRSIGYKKRFASLLGYNISLFNIADEISEMHHNFIYGEENDSKGASPVTSILFEYLTPKA